MTVQEHSAYKKARELSKIIWQASRQWDKYILSTVGNQLIRATDSISANLAEGWNRYSKRDKINFFIIARGSANETCDWVEKAYERQLLGLSDYKQVKIILDELPKDINGLIKGTRLNLKK